MSNPYAISLDEKKWNKFEPVELSGFLRRPSWNNQGSYSMWWTSRDIGGTAPIDTDKTDNGLSMRLFECGNTESFETKSSQDFYIYIRNANNNSTDSTILRVDE